MIFIKIAIVLLIVLILAIATWVVMRIRKIMESSLPKLSGQLTVPGLSANSTVRIETDSQGVPRIIGDSSESVLYGLGYVHARDRFFQMDLARRYASGELAELLGGGASIIESDKNIRRHRFRSLCEKVVESFHENDRLLIEKYTEGVNQGLADLKSKPWEYFVLKCNPRVWKPEDSMLVSQSIALFLEGGDLSWHQANGLIHDLLPQELAEFLTSRGSQWDAPIVGDAFPEPPVPSSDSVNLRNLEITPDLEAPESWTRLETKVLGSNGWLVSGNRQKGLKNGPALVANDMHLGLALPTSWYKVSLITNDKTTGETHEVHGVTLPGGPPVVAGSNGHIAWGLTSAQGDWGDLLTLETDPKNPRRYRTPSGYEEMQSYVETIHVRGGSDVNITMDWTIWGPVVDQDLEGRPRVWRWVAQEFDGVNLKIAHMAHCKSVQEAMELAPECGVPHVNFMVGDAYGHIGWTIMGRIPRRVGGGIVDERRPMEASDLNSGWDGYLSAAESPRVVDPPEGLIWSANHRMVDGEMLQKIGRGRFDRGVRASRIRDLLKATENHDEDAMLAIQMNDTALLMQDWRDLIASELTDQVALQMSQRATFRNHILKWSGRADSESIGYALLNECRLRIVREVLGPLTAPIRRAEAQASYTKPKFALRHIGLETPVWAILRERPLHLLSPKYQTWQELILKAVDDTAEHALQTGWPTWGQVNTLRLSHPFALKMKVLRPWLSAAPIYSSGAITDMPKIQSPEFGASQRMAVFPGRESNGIMQLPGGQSGHPMSPHYLDLLHDWVHHGRTPLIAGKAEHVLILKGKSV